MPQGRIDVILAGIFQRKAADKPPLREPVTTSKAHWQPKKAGGRKYLPKPPPPKLTIQRQITGFSENSPWL